MASRESIVICAFYRFVKLDDYASLRWPLLSLLRTSQVKGTVLLAPEGINGAIAGSRAGIDEALRWLKADPRLRDLEHKESVDDEIPFYRTRVKLKKEIVTMGVAGLDVARKTGVRVKPRDWNKLISDPQIILIDARNEYEMEIGTFKGAENPRTGSFREFPDYADSKLDPHIHKKIAMFCTGGIRCEKSSAYLREKGFAEVYHLDGGILKYLEEIPASESLWQGECFVFDNRVAVNHELKKGNYEQCHACRLPISAADKASPRYEKGVSCPRCFDKKSAARKRGFRERQKQIQLAVARGQTHLGEEAATE